MEPLRIDFTLSGQVAEMSHPLHLDGLLAYAATEDNGGDWRNISLPLEQENGVYKASAIQFERGGAAMISRIQRTEPSIFIDGYGRYTYSKRHTSKIDTAKSTYKNSQMFTPVFFSTHARAYCIGDKAEVERLLKYIRTLGPLGKLGLGRITETRVVSVSVEEGDKWMERVLTWCPNEADYFPLQAAATFPYWKPENIKQNWVHKNVA